MSNLTWKKNLLYFINPEHKSYYNNVNIYVIKREKATGENNAAGYEYEVFSTATWDVFCRDKFLKTAADLDGAKKLAEEHFTRYREKIPTTIQRSF